MRYPHCTHFPILKSFTIFFNALSPQSSCAATLCIVTDLSASLNSSTHWGFMSAAEIDGLPLHGLSLMLVIPSLNFFIHLSTLLLLMVFISSYLNVRQLAPFLCQKLNDSTFLVLGNYYLPAMKKSRKRYNKVSVYVQIQFEWLITMSTFALLLVHSVCVSLEFYIYSKTVDIHVTTHTGVLLNEFNTLS